MGACDRRARACVKDGAGGISLFARDAVAAAGFTVFCSCGTVEPYRRPRVTCAFLERKLRLRPIRSGPYSLLPFSYLAFCRCACGAFGSVL